MLGALRVMRQPAGFDPLASITWLAAYWTEDPDWTPPADGADVASWRDGSGNSRDLAEASTKPVYRATEADLNNKPVVDFNGTNDKLSWTGTLSQAQPVSIIIVGADAVGGAGSGAIFGMKSGGGGGANVYLDTAGGTSYLQTPNWAGAVLAGAGTGGHFWRFLASGASSRMAQDEAVSGTFDSGTNGITDAIYVGHSGHSFYGQIKVAFAGVYAGDITGVGSWSAFKSWVMSQYGLTIA